MKKLLIIAAVLGVMATVSCRNGNVVPAIIEAALPDSASHAENGTAPSAPPNSTTHAYSLPEPHFTADSVYLIVGVGDVMMGINYPDTAMRLTADDAATLFAHAKPYISAADVAVCNLEGVLLDSAGTPKEVKNAEALHLFRMPER